MSASSPSRAVAEHMSGADWGLLLLLGAIWGASFFFVEIALAELEPAVLVLLRVGIAAVALQFYLLMAGPSFHPTFAQFGAFAGLALLNNLIPFGLIFTGQTAMGAGLASVLNATTPFWTLLLVSSFTADERLSANKLVGVCIGVAGTAVTIGPGLGTNLGGPVWAKLALIGAALSYGLALIYARRFRGVPAPVIATGQLTLSTLIALPLVLWTYGPAALLPRAGEVWAAVLALALVSTAFAYLLYFRLLATAGATNASLVTLVVPVTAILLGAVFLGEQLAWFEFAGMVLIALGLITIDGGFARWIVTKRIGL